VVGLFEFLTARKKSHCGRFIFLNFLKKGWGRSARLEVLQEKSDGLCNYVKSASFFRFLKLFVRFTVIDKFPFCKKRKRRKGLARGGFRRAHVRAESDN